MHWLQDQFHHSKTIMKLTSLKLQRVNAMHGTNSNRLLNNSVALLWGSNLIGSHLPLLIYKLNSKGCLNEKVSSNSCSCNHQYSSAICRGACEYPHYALLRDLMAQENARRNMFFGGLSGRISSGLLD